jgi:hypothetical protein
MAILLGVLVTSALAVVAFVFVELRFEPLALVVGTAIGLVPCLVVASVLRARRIALRFMRETTPLVGYVDEGGLVLLSPEGLFREGKEHVAFNPHRAADGALARVVHDVEKGSLMMVVLWKPPGKAKPMEEREHVVVLPSSVSPTHAAAVGRELAALRGCPFTTG